MVEKEKFLKHLGIVMDGNRRWAKGQNLSIKNGHKAGADKLTEVIDWCIEFNIKYLTVYAFSTENWKRDDAEINNIMSLLKEYLSTKKTDFIKKGIKIKIIGIEDNIEKDIIEKVRKIEKETENNDIIQVDIAFNYGGRMEILDVTKKIAQQVKDNFLNIKDINEETFKKNLYYGNIPDLDLVIRTGGEFRISNFLLWQIAYAELYFTDTFWPAFDKQLFVNIINNFYKRERRYGGTIKE